MIQALGGASYNQTEITTMERNPKHTAIIDRIEEMRHALKLSKTKFCLAFGMRPQTYNNFIGSQGSKPSVELIRGAALMVPAADRPALLGWLLFGEGENGAPPISERDRLDRLELKCDRLEADLRGHYHGMEGEEETGYPHFADPDGPAVPAGGFTERFQQPVEPQRPEA